jgi:hypothetical protein
MLNPCAESDELKSFDIIPKFWRLLRLFWDKDRVEEWPSLNLDDDDDDIAHNDDGGQIYSNVYNSLKRVREWVGAEEAVGITQETSTVTPRVSVIECEEKENHRGVMFRP